MSVRWSRPRLRPGLVAAGFAGGLALGLAAWSAGIYRWRRELFSASPLRRLAALGYLEGAPPGLTAPLLDEYVRWEPRPTLRRRAERLRRRARLHLD